MMLKVDHFTPLSRAVASIDRDSYAARFAIYEREHKALLRRLATAEPPCSDEDVAREEQAFRDAIRRIEFADEDERPALVPQSSPVEEEEQVEGDKAPFELQADPIWPQPLRSESLAAPILPDQDQFEDAATIDPGIQLSEPRSVARRVGERLALAVVILAVGGVGILVGEGPRGATGPSDLHDAVDSTRSAAADIAADAKSQQPTQQLTQPTWLSPEILYAPPPLPSPVSPLRADIRLPPPRPER